MPSKMVSQHKHHQYSFHQGRPMSSNASMRSKRLAFLNRKANAATHQPLQDDESKVLSDDDRDCNNGGNNIDNDVRFSPGMGKDYNFAKDGDDYNRVCYPQMSGDAKKVDDTNIQIVFCQERIMNNDEAPKAASEDFNVDNVNITYSVTRKEDDSPASPGEHKQLKHQIANKDIKVRNVDISYSVSRKGEDAPAPSKEHNPLKQRAIAAMKFAKVNRHSRSATLHDIPSWDRESAMEMAKVNSYGTADLSAFKGDLDRSFTALDTTLRRDNTSNAAAGQRRNDSMVTPMSIRTEEHVSLLNMDKESTLKQRALAALEVFTVNSYFTPMNVFTTPASRSTASSGRDIIASESLAWQLDSFQSAENTPKNEEQSSNEAKEKADTDQNENESVIDIDIVASESQDELETGNVDNEPKPLSLLNDFSFTFKQMINTTFTSEDGRSTHSDDTSDDESIPSSKDEEAEDDESLSDDSITYTENADEVVPVSESADHKPAVKRFSMGIAKIAKHSKSLSRRRSNSMSSASSQYSEYESVSSFDGDADQKKPMKNKFTKRLGKNFKKLTLSRTASTSPANSSSGSSVPDLLDDDESSIPSLDDDDESMVSFGSSQDGEDSDSMTSYLSSRFSDLNSPTSLDSQVCKLPAAIDSDDERSTILADEKDEPVQSTSDNSKDETLLISTVINMTLSRINSLAEQIEQEASLNLSIEKENIDRSDEKGTVFDFSIANKFSPTKETLGMEMIAHPKLLHKYD